jgi:hypothetical protein
MSVYLVQIAWKRIHEYLFCMEQITIVHYVPSYLYDTLDLLRIPSVHNRPTMYSTNVAEKTPLARA